MSWFIIIFVIGLLYWLVARSLMRPLSGSAWQKKFIRGIVAICFFITALMPLFWFVGGENQLRDFYLRVAYFDLGFFSMLFPLLLLRDGVLLFFRAPEIFRKLRLRIGSFNTRKDEGASVSEEPGTESAHLSRHDFIIRASNFAALGLNGGLLAYGYSQLDEFRIVRKDVPILGLPAAFDGFRIAQITDLHIGPQIKRKFVENVVRRVNELGADMIAVTGDLVDGSVAYLKESSAPLMDLHARSGIYFCTGNHEYYSGADRWCEAFAKMGMTVLQNENRILKRGSSKILIAGVTDFRAGNHIPSHKTDPYAALQGAPPDIKRILLAHQPRSIYVASDAGYDLQISGHTHGGQYYPYQLLVALTQPYIFGLHKHENTWIYVSRGVGYWGPPQRIGAPPEITLLRLRTDDVLVG